MNYNPQTYEFFDGAWSLFASLVTFFVFLLLLDLVVRAVALWKAARADQMAWFIALIIFNTVGILPIIYLLFFIRKPAIKVAKKTSKRQKS